MISLLNLVTSIRTGYQTCFRGPSDTPYAEGVFQLAIDCGTDYPLAPPSIKFVAKVFIFTTGTHLHHTHTYIIISTSSHHHITTCITTSPHHHHHHHHHHIIITSHIYTHHHINITSDRDTDNHRDIDTHRDVVVSS